MSGGIEHIGHGVVFALFHPEAELGKEFLAVLVGTQGTHIDFDLDLIGSIIFDCDGLGDTVTGHYILEIGKQVRG